MSGLGLTAMTNLARRRVAAPAWLRSPRIGAALDRLRGPVAVLALATAAAVLCGLFLHPRAFVLAAGTASVLLVGLAWPWLSVRGLGASLAFDRDRVREGEPVTVRLVVRNRLPVAAWGLAVRGGGPGLDGGLARARGWGTSRAAWDVAPARWGTYPGSSPRVASAFPFGLREGSRPLAVPAPLLVWPATFPVGPIPEDAAGRDGDGQAPRDRAGVDGDLLGVRPYRRGDSLRRVHWPQTARHGQLIVCELHALATPRVQVVVDVHPDAHDASGHPDGTLAWAVRVAASFAEGWAGQGAEVEVIAGRDRTRSGPGPIAARRARLLDALARCEPDPDLGPVPTLAELLDAEDARGPFDGLRVVVATDRAARGLPPRPPRTRAERFVLLRAGAFQGGEGRNPLDADAVPLPVVPWITLDDPARVATAVRLGWKEAARG